MSTLIILAFIPFLLSILSFCLPSLRWVKFTVAAGLWLQLCLAIVKLFPVLVGSVEQIRFSEDLCINNLGACFVVLTTFVVAAAMTQANWFFELELVGKSPEWDSHLRLFYACVNWFLLSMSAVFFCDNLGFLWICVEATTLSSAPLVYFNRTKQALEATWKYLIVCSVAIAFALLGTIFIFAASQQGVHNFGTLCSSQLIVDGNLHYSLLRLGFIFCLLGYGTKAGIFPLHSWLPDTYSEAPAPASAMLSGALSNCALYAIYRISQILVMSKHSALSQHMLVIAGAVTVLAASIFLIRQHSLKKLWAYSSVANVGFILVAIGLNSTTLFFLQALNNCLAKVAIFLISGSITQAYGTKKLNSLHGLLRVSPVYAVLLALGAMAIAGVPPFGTFVSELSILIDVATPYSGIVLAILLAAIATIFVSICIHIGGVLVGGFKDTIEIKQVWGQSFIPITLLGCSLLLGVFFGVNGWWYHS